MNTTQTSGPDTPSTASMAAPADDGIERDEAQSTLRRVLRDPNQSALKKYMALTVGKLSIWALLRYELLTGLLGGLPGALGLVLRRKFYRRLFGRCGRGVVIGRHVTIRHPHRIALGDNVVIDDNCVLDAKGDQDTVVEIGSNSIIGRNTILSSKGGTLQLASTVNISANCTLLSETDMTIGHKTLIAGHCYLIAGGNHGIERTDVPPCDQPMQQRGGTHIDKHCWLGAHVTVLDGVHLGRDVVVAAGAVVNRSAEPFAVIGGVPAKVLRIRGAQSAESGQKE